MTAGPQVRWCFHSQGIAHFVDDDWNLVERLLDFHHMGDKEHAGAMLQKLL